MIIKIELEMECECVVIMNNKVLQEQGELQSGCYLSGGDTLGNTWDWATCMDCGQQHQVNKMKRSNC